MELILILIIIFLPLIANAKINSSYKKYSKIKNSAGLTGKDVARKILDKHGLSNVNIISVPGKLSDHYDPKRKHVALSCGDDTSIASLAVAAHEVGHAIQDKEAYSYLRFRSALVPVVNFASSASTIFIVIGFMSEMTLFLVDIGILLLLVGLLFQLITLPVEFNASKRAKEELVSMGLITDVDQKGTASVLNAAAFTYVAGFLAMALQILRLIMVRNRD